MKRIILLLIILSALLACSKSDLDNPFDPDVNLQAPTNFSVEIILDNQIELTWEDSFHRETQYRIDRRDEGQAWEIVHTTEVGNINNWIDTDFEQYENIQYRIAVIYDEKVSPFAVSDIIEYYPAPTDFVVYQGDINSFLLTWEDNCNCESGYEIGRSINGDDYVNVAVTDENITEYQDNINSRDIYNVMYRIRAKLDVNHSAYSYAARVLNFPAPTEMEIIQIGLSSLRITWNNNAMGHQGYKLDKKINGEWIIEYAQVGAEETSYDDMNVSLNDEVQYRVYAFNNDFISEPETSEIVQNSLSIPMNFHYTIESSTRLTIHWDYYYSDLDGFVVEKNTNNSGWEMLSEVEGEVRSVVDENFDIFQTYSYRAKSLYGDFESEFEQVDFLIDESMIYVVGGTYTIGDTWDLGLDDEKPTHAVTISDFWMSEKEITFAEYDEYCEDTNQPLVNDRGWGRDEHPIMNVSWLDAIRYCNWKSEQDGFLQAYEIDGLDVTFDINATGYSLPTEAEWEYAAKGGENENNTIYSGSDIAADVAVIDSDRTNIVGSKASNELGFYDLSGNVWEWCWDLYSEETYQNDVSSGNIVNPTGAETGSYRVFRGGAWSHDETAVRVANRSALTSDYTSDSVGFRIVRRR